MSNRLVSDRDMLFAGFERVNAWLTSGRDRMEEFRAEGLDFRNAAARYAEIESITVTQGLERVDLLEHLTNIRLERA